MIARYFIFPLCNNTVPHIFRVMSKGKDCVNRNHDTGIISGMMRVQIPVKGNGKTFRMIA